MEFDFERLIETFELDTKLLPRFDIFPNQNRSIHLL